MSAEQVRMERIKSLLKEMFNAIKSLDYSQSKGDASEQVYQSAESSFDSAQEENEDIIKNVSQQNKPQLYLMPRARWRNRWY